MKEFDNTKSDEKMDELQVEDVEDLERGTDENGRYLGRSKRKEKTTNLDDAWEQAEEEEMSKKKIVRKRHAQVRSDKENGRN